MYRRILVYMLCTYLSSGIVSALHTKRQASTTESDQLIIGHDSHPVHSTVLSPDTEYSISHRFLLSSRKRSTSTGYPRTVSPDLKSQRGGDCLGDHEEDDIDHSLKIESARACLDFPADLASGTSTSADVSGSRVSTADISKDRWNDDQMMNVAFPSPVDSDSAPTPDPVLPTSTFDPTLPDDCKTCWIIYKYASVYFPAPTTSNTECLTDGAAMPSPSLPSGLQPDSEKVYVVIPELSAGNACTQIAKFTSQTFTFGPGELSTVQGPANLTKAFNFEDLPCPPPDLASEVIWFYNPAYNPAQTYAPFLAPFSQLYELDPAFQHCTVAMNQGLDPPRPQPPADGPTTPLPNGPHHLGARRPQQPPMAAHKVPHIPTATSSPGSD